MDNAQKEATIVELRVDYLRNLHIDDLKLIKQKTYRKSIFCYRSVNDGGQFSGPVQQQIKILQAANDLGFNYIDIDLAKAIHIPFKNFNSKIILSYHNFNKIPTSDELELIFNQMHFYQPHVYKFATMAHNEQDPLTLLEFLLGKKQNIIVLGMGEGGKITRILSPLLGGFLTFAAYNSSQSAPEQIDIKMMRDILENLTDSFPIKCLELIKTKTPLTCEKTIMQEKKIKEGDFLGEKYKQQSEHQQKYNNINNDKLIHLIEKFYPQAKSSQPLSIGDLGCGHGVPTIDLLLKMRNNGLLIKEIVGYDISASQIQQANQLKSQSFPTSELFFYQKDIQALQEQERFDVMLSWFTLHWMNDIKIARDSIYQALKPGGMFIHLTSLEKPTLFELRRKLLTTPKWKNKFIDYELNPFLKYNISNETKSIGYEEIFAENFHIESIPSYREDATRIFQTKEEFRNFLKSWIQELRVERNGQRVLTDEEQNEYVFELVESFNNLSYNSSADINLLPDGRIEFHEHYIFSCWHKPLPEKKIIYYSEAPALTFWQEKILKGFCTSDNIETKAYSEPNKLNIGV